MDRIKLVIDPGHGGEDPGAVNAELNLRESDINLNVCLILKAIFDTHPEYEVKMTRTGDVSLNLNGRTLLTNGLNAKLVSVHCNAAAKPGAQGVEAWCFSEEDGSGRVSEGYRLASSIANEVATLGLKNRGPKAIYDRKTKQYIFRPLWILRKSIRPAVIVECGFVSNPEDAAKLDVDLDGFNERVAVALFRGIDVVLNPKPKEESNG